MHEREAIFKKTPVAFANCHWLVLLTLEGDWALGRDPISQSLWRYVERDWLMGNTADLVMVQKTIIDTFHKEGKSQRVITERGGCSRSAVSKHIKCKVDWKEDMLNEWKEKKRKGKGAKATGIQTLGRASQGVNWSWSQYIKSHHAQTSSGKGLPSHIWNKNIVSSILPGLRTKRTGLLLSGPKSSFQMKANFAFHLEIKVPESGGREERHNIHVAWSPVWSFQSVMIWAAISSSGVGPLCFLKSTVNVAIYQAILEHCMLPSADKLYGDADFIFQQVLAPTHTAKGTKSWFNDHSFTVLDWPANSPDLNPIENIWGIVKRKMRDTRTNKCRWPEGRYQSNLGFHYTWAVPQADCLHATPHWCSNSCKRRPNQVNRN